MCYKWVLQVKLYRRFLLLNILREKTEANESLKKMSWQDIMMHDNWLRHQGTCLQPQCRKALCVQLVQKSSFNSANVCVIF